MLKRYQSRILFAGILSLLVFYGAMPAYAQEAQQTQEKQTPEHLVKIYRIKHQDAQELMASISQLAGTHTMGANADTPRIAVDRQTNSLIVAGNEKTHEMISTLLQSLDVSSPKPKIIVPTARDVMIRIVWLVDEDLVEGDATAIPPDLIPTVEKLSTKFGLGKLVTAGQIIINQRIVQQTQFEGSGTASVYEISEFKVRGTAKFSDDQIADLEVHVQTTSLGIELPAELQAWNKPKIPMCELASKISAPIGRPVFFGMAPIASKTSLFVVQVLDANSVADETARSYK